jgi:hypothetical protein
MHEATFLIEEFSERAHRGQINTVELSNKSAFTAGQDWTVREWRLVNFEEDSESIGRHHVECVKTLRGESIFNHALPFSDLLLCASESGEITMYNTNGERDWLEMAKARQIHGVRRLGVMHAQGLLSFHALRQQLTNHADKSQANAIVSGDHQGIKIYDAQLNRVTQFEFDASIYSISATASFVLLGTSAHRALIVDPRCGIVCNLKHESLVRTVAVSSSHAILSADHTLKEWDVRASSKAPVNQWHYDGPVWSVAEQLAEMDGEHPEGYIVASDALYLGHTRLVPLGGGTGEVRGPFSMAVGDHIWLACDVLSVWGWPMLLQGEAPITSQHCPSIRHCDLLSDQQHCIATDAVGNHTVWDIIAARRASTQINELAEKHEWKQESIAKEIGIHRDPWCTVRTNGFGLTVTVDARRCFDSISRVADLCAAGITLHGRHASKCCVADTLLDHIVQRHHPELKDHPIDEQNALQLGVAENWGGRLVAGGESEAWKKAIVKRFKQRKPKKMLKFSLTPLGDAAPLPETHLEAGASNQVKKLVHFVAER